MLGVVSLRDRDGSCFCISACFETRPDAAFLKINTFTLGRFYASSFFSPFLQDFATFPLATSILDCLSSFQISHRTKGFALEGCSIRTSIK